MLGEKLGEERGKVTGYRVLPPDGQDPKGEVSLQASGKLLGHDSRSRWTYWVVTRADGTSYGEGQGIVMTAEGDVATFTGAGAGKMTGSARGCIYYRTKSERLVRLNGTAAVYEYELDREGNSHVQVWEWQ